MNIFESILNGKIANLPSKERKMKKLALLTLLITFFLPSAAQDFPVDFQNFSTDDGLPDNSVRSIFQDSSGLIWLCTREGICMYDGMHFQQLEDSSCDILDGLAMSLAEDREHRLWFVTTLGIGFHDLETGENRTVRRSAARGLVGAADIAVDRNGMVWIANEDIFCWDPVRQQLIDYSPVALFTSNSVEADSNGSVWFLATSGDLYRFNKIAGTFDRVRYSGLGERFSRQDLASDNAGHILSSAYGGLVLQTDIFTNATTTLYRTGAGEIRCIVPEPDGRCWLGTESGIILMDGNQSYTFTHDKTDPESLAGEDVWSMLRDRQGNIWVGMFYNGLALHKNLRNMVFRHLGRQSGGDLSGDMIRPIVVVDDAHILAGAEDGGLNLLSLTDETVEDLTFPGPDGKPVNIQGLCLDGKDLWIATFGNGMYRMDFPSRKIQKNYLSDLSAATVYRTNSGDIYLGTTSGLYRYDRAEDRFQSCPEFGSAFIHALFEDSRGDLWVGTYGNGVWTGKSGEYRHITTADKAYGLTSDYITCIREDSRHRLWVLTEAGGACYAGMDEIVSGEFQFRNLSRKTGLPTSIACCLLEDLDQVLWITTTHGIVKLSPDDLTIREVYIEDRGNMLNQYSYGSGSSTSGGRLFFGTSRGLIGFMPSSERNSRRPLQLFITEISVSGPAGTFPVTGPNQSAIRTEKVRIKYADLSALTIRYAAPDFQSSRASMFETVLEGRRKTIRNITYSGDAVYTDLSPGSYKFSVSGIGARRGATRTLEIEIVPPFFMSRIAMVLYILLLGLILFLLARQWDNYRQMKMLRKVERLQAETQKELYDAKINFFTNITHEIRTPLSLIKMPLDKIISSGNYTESNQQELLTMQKNTDRLLSLTNQLLDLRKMEKMEIKPTFLSNDLAALVRKTCDRFLNMAEDQHIRMDVTLPETPFPVDCAAEMVDKIIANMVSNACKYGDGYVRVALEPVPGGERVRIRVDSDGERIPESDVEQIFEKFYQGTPARQSKGTGLGLPYARSLAALHGGTLTLDRSVKDYNSFVLELPVHQEATVEMPAKHEKEAEETHAPVDNLLHTILVVEDDPEMRGYLAKELSEQYNVLVAANGEDALKLVESQRIDLIVSDIMMPGIDGVTLCNRIKSTTEYCHIPVILLTAAVGMETRIETLDAGADGYIEKPFAIELLQANIANLFKNREIANRQFTQSPLTHFNSMVTGGMDQEFMERLHETVMKHLAEPDLNIETLTSELGTSKSTLYRKVTANTGLNINEYIRVSRLKKAAEMLSSQKYRISEVAYMTGFSSPSYFATCFQKQFNVSPSSFVKGLKG